MFDMDDKEYHTSTECSNMISQCRRYEDSLSDQSQYDQYSDQYHEQYSDQFGTLRGSLRGSVRDSLGDSLDCDNAVEENKDDVTTTTMTTTIDENGELHTCNRVPPSTRPCATKILHVIYVTTSLTTKEKMITEMIHVTTKRTCSNPGSRRTRWTAAGCWRRSCTLTPCRCATTSGSTPQTPAPNCTSQDT